MNELQLTRALETLQGLKNASQKNQRPTWRVSDVWE